MQPQKGSVTIATHEPSSGRTPIQKVVMGVVLSMLCGAFTAAQYGVLDPAKAAQMKLFRCGINAIRFPIQPTQEYLCTCTNQTVANSINAYPILNRKYHQSVILYKSYNNHESWMVTLGISALLITMCLYALVYSYHRTIHIHTSGMYIEEDKELPPLH